MSLFSPAPALPDRKTFWNGKILDWEDSRYGAPGGAGGWLERWAGRASASLRFRLAAALALLAPHARGRRVVEIGCGSGLLADPLMAAGALSYRGYDLSDVAVAKARDRLAGSLHAAGIGFEVAAVADLPEQGDAVVFSLGLTDWLTDAEMAHLFAIGRAGDYLHALSEKRPSLAQVLHRLYVTLSYGRRTGYRPRYYAMGDIVALLARQGLAPPVVYRDSRLSFGAFVTSLAWDGRRLP